MDKFSTSLPCRAYIVNKDDFTCMLSLRTHSCGHFWSHGHLLHPRKSRLGWRISPRSNNFHSYVFFYVGRNENWEIIFINYHYFYFQNLPNRHFQITLENWYTVIKNCIMFQILQLYKYILITFPSSVWAIQDILFSNLLRTKLKRTFKKIKIILLECNLLIIIIKYPTQSKTKKIFLTIKAFLNFNVHNSFYSKRFFAINEIGVYFLIIVIMTNGELLIWLIIPVHLTQMGIVKSFYL